MSNHVYRIYITAYSQILLSLQILLYEFCHFVCRSCALVLLLLVGVLGKEYQRREPLHIHLRGLVHRPVHLCDNHIISVAKLCRQLLVGFSHIFTVPTPRSEELHEDSLRRVDDHVVEVGCCQLEDFALYVS